MAECKHPVLTLLETRIRKRIRCRHCHLTIAEEELRDGHCPECYEEFGVRRSDFESVISNATPTTRYRCDTCGAVIE